MHPTTIQASAAHLYDWIVEHDQRKLFVILYTVLALVLSIGVGLFWLVLLVALHLGFEYVHFRHHGHSVPSALRAAAWALRLDLTLVLFALVLVLYLKTVFGVLGLQAAGRAGAAVQAGVRSGARFAAWERALRGMLLSADDAIRSLRAVAMLRASGASAGSVGAVSTAAVVVEAAAQVPARMSRGDRMVLVIAVGFALLIAAAPWLGHESSRAVLGTLAAELHPFPGR